MAEETEYIKLKVKCHIYKIHICQFRCKLNSAGGWAGLKWDPLQSEANHPDGKTQEELQWEGKWKISSKYHCPKFIHCLQNSLATNDCNLKHGDGLVIVVLAQGGGAGHQPALSLWRQAHQRRWNSQGTRDGTSRNRPSFLRWLLIYFHSRVHLIF